MSKRSQSYSQKQKSVQGVRYKLTPDYFAPEVPLTVGISQIKSKLLALAGQRQAVQRQILVRKKPVTVYTAPSFRTFLKQKPKPPSTLQKLAPLLNRYALFNPLRGIQAAKSVCDVRLARKQVLFAAKIAGLRRRLSPGQGGHYRRTETSYYSCR